MCRVLVWAYKGRVDIASTSDAKMKFAIEHSFAARLQRRWTMIAQSSRAYIAGRAPAPGRTRRLVARAPPSMGVGVYGRRCFGAEEILRTSPSFFPKRTCKNCTDIRRNSAMILRVLVGFSSPRRFLTSQPRSAGHLQWLRGSYTPSVEALRITPPIAA